MCCEGVHVDCNATVEGCCIVPSGTKIYSGEIYKKQDTVKMEDLFFDTQRSVKQSNDIFQRTPQEIEGLEYTFESGM